MTDYFPELFATTFEEIEQKTKESKKNRLTQNSNRYLKVSSNKLSVSHLSASPLQTDASIQSIDPFYNFQYVGYFEIYVEETNGNGGAAIGLALKNYPTNKQPGWLDGSYGYHGDDGNKFHNSSSPGKSYGPVFGVGDTIGCGYIFRTREIFFTKNGKFLGIAFKAHKDRVLYPTIGLDHSFVHINFGENDFEFKIGDLIEDEKKKEFEDVDTYKLENEGIRKLVVSYLIHQGYKNTVKILDEKNSQYELEFRFEIKRLILKGKIEETLDLLNQKFPFFLNSKKESKAMLYYQLFIEYIKSDELLVAIEVAQNYFDEFQNFSSVPEVYEIIGLLAYESPKDSPLSYLLNQEQRKKTVDFINQEIIEYLGGEKNSALENSLSGLSVTYNQLKFSGK
eukprot:gene83-4332_t